MAKNIDFMGAIFPDVPSVKLPQQGGGLVAFDDTTDATATADKILQGYTAYANGQKLVGTASGGITPSGTMSITSNGIYDIVSFASVDVQVSGGGGITADEIAMNAISGAISGSASFISSYAFVYNTKITGASFPNAMNVGNYAFSSCKNLSALYVPIVESVGYSGFCSLAISEASFPLLKRIEQYAFAYCNKLEMASFPKMASIAYGAFYYCTKLESLYLLGSSIASLGAPNAFQYTPISNSVYLGHYGSIYVPASLVDSYKSARYWSLFSDRITAYEG